MRLSRLTKDYILTLYFRFPPDSHSVIKPVRVLVTRVLYYVSNKFKVSTTFRFGVNLRYGTDRQTDKQATTLYRPDTSALWLLTTWQQCALVAGASRYMKTTYVIFSDI